MATIDTDVQSAGVRRVLWVTLVLNLAVSAGKVLVGHLSAAWPWSPTGTTAWSTAPTTSSA